LISVKAGVTRAGESAGRAVYVLFPCGALRRYLAVAETAMNVKLQIIKNDGAM
jgi:hypothetical protein